MKAPAQNALLDRLPSTVFAALSSARNSSERGTLGGSPARDVGLTALLCVQVLTLFVVIPLGAAYPEAGGLLTLCHLAFAAICVTVLTRSHLVRAGLLAGIVLLASAPLVAPSLSAQYRFGAAFFHEGTALVAFAFNAVVTALVARRVFGPGRVTAHRIQGAILLYLNVAALFAIAYGAIVAAAPGAIAPATGSLATAAGPHTAQLTYFSLATITTTGYGDLVPVHAMARSLANLEAVFGHLFPATVLARLVALHLAHEGTPLHGK